MDGRPEMNMTETPVTCEVVGEVGTCEGKGSRQRSKPGNCKKGLLAAWTGVAGSVTAEQLGPEPTNCRAKTDTTGALLTLVVEEVVTSCGWRGKRKCCRVSSRWAPAIEAHDAGFKLDI
jgi:hypothetical protein